tara:strand:+ start:1823 stop:3616 length:1794 start_codon:yes stop_codon:yes gene_type:complete
MKVQKTADSGKNNDAKLNLQYRSAKPLPPPPKTISKPRAQRAEDQTQRLVAASLMRPGRWVSYSRNRNHYAGKPAPYGYQRTLDAIDWLSAMGVIDHDRVKPHALDDGPGRQSRYKLNAKGLAEFETARIEYAGPLIVAKDKNKTPVECTETESSREIRSEIAEINDCTRQHDIRADGIYCFDLRMICNSEQAGKPFRLSKGGRLYANAQRISRKARSLITIDGEQTDEIDFSHIQPSMICELLGRSMEGDPYQIPGFEREEGKAGWMRVNFSRSRKAAIQALSSYDRKRHKPPLMSRERAEQLIERLDSVDVPDLALIMQRLDGEFARQVCVMLARQDIPCLPLHDSFRVRLRDVEARNAVFSEALKALYRSEVWTKQKRRFSALFGVSLQKASYTMGMPSPVPSTGGIVFQQEARRGAVTRDATPREPVTCCSDRQNVIDDSQKRPCLKNGDFQNVVKVKIEPVARAIDPVKRGNRQRLVMLLNNHSRSDLARKMDISGSYLAKMIAGTRDISGRVADALIAVETIENRKRLSPPLDKGMHNGKSNTPDPAIRKNFKSREPLFCRQDWRLPSAVAVEQQSGNRQPGMEPGVTAVR